MSKGLLSCDIPVIRDIASYTPDCESIMMLLNDFEILQRQRRACGAPRPDVEAAIALRDSNPEVAKLWSECNSYWIPISKLGFPHIAERMVNESMAEVIFAATHPRKSSATDALMATA